MNRSTGPSTKTAAFTRPSRARNGEVGLSLLSSGSRIASRCDPYEDSFIAQRIFLTPRGWHGRGAQDRDYGPPRRRQDVLPSQGHRDARGRRPQGRRDDHGADRQAKPAGRILCDGLGDERETRVRLARDHVEDDGEPQPAALQDCETHEGRGPLRTKGYLGLALSRPPWSFRFQALRFPREPRTSSSRTCRGAKALGPPDRGRSTIRRWR